MDELYNEAIEEVQQERPTQEKLLQNTGHPHQHETVSDHQTGEFVPVDWFFS